MMQISILEVNMSLQDVYKPFFQIEFCPQKKEIYNNILNKYKLNFIWKI